MQHIESNTNLYTHAHTNTHIHIQRATFSPPQPHFIHQGHILNGYVLVACSMCGHCTVAISATTTKISSKQNPVRNYYLTLAFVVQIRVFFLDFPSLLVAIICILLLLLLASSHVYTFDFDFDLLTSFLLPSAPVLQLSSAINSSYVG